ncbi:Asr1405/Asl0597 family protein [Nodosilinea nodulosa]|uniref:Asr1405/Asl0597 family protein n=1 Tax=Nodosilinea nodulosa TaxID=416001 RepID=UPI0002F912C2|nr:Asr1405/Asl0597 family protein [Nodosilinea nodulosa]
MHVLEPEFLGSGPDFDPAAQARTSLELDRINRWTVYRRLQELGLTCECRCDRPLTVVIHTPADALQVWSVVQATSKTKQSLADHLERCWQQRNLQ